MANPPKSSIISTMGSLDTLRLFLVRHGEAAANREMRYLGSRDDPLTERGRKQAVAVATALETLSLQCVYSSPLARAAETAGFIASACGIELQTDDRLREGSFGTWEGLNRAEVVSRSEEDARLIQRWESDPNCSPPDGESFQQIQARILDFISELADRRSGASVVLVSHVGPIKAVLAAALDSPLSTAQHLFLDPATVTVVDWGKARLIRLFNSHAHLGWDRARWMHRD